MFWQKLQILELTPPKVPLKSVDAETLESLTLHPGFIYLVQQLELEAQVLDHKLRHERQETLREYESLQLGAYWWRRLSTKLESLCKISRANIREAQENELEVFTRMSQNIKVVGL